MLYLELRVSRSLQLVVQVCTQSPHYTAMDLPVNPAQFSFYTEKYAGRVNLTEQEEKDGEGAPGRMVTTS